jgi:hypothetical protein
MAGSRRSQVDRSIPPAGTLSDDQVEQHGDNRRRFGSVGDVLPGERVLVHLGPHVARIECPHPKPGVLGGQDRAQVVECRL